MKKTVLYIAAVLAVSGGLMWQKPMVAHAEPEVIQEAPVSTVLEVATEEDSDEDNGPAPEIQAAKKLEEELAAQEKPKVEAYCKSLVDARMYLVFRLRFIRCYSWAEVAGVLGKGYTEDGVSRMAYNYLNKS